MNTVALKTPQTVDTDTKEMQDKIFAVIEASWKAMRKFAWTILHTPAYSDQLLRDKNLGIEYRRMRF
jgi:hypothetical protein